MVETEEAACENHWHTALEVRGQLDGREGWAWRGRP